MDETLIAINNHINKCFECLRGITSIYILTECENYLNEEMVNIPKTKTPIYLNREYVKLNLMMQRIKILKKILEMSRQIK